MVRWVVMVEQRGHFRVEGYSNRVSFGGWSLNRAFSAEMCPSSGGGRRWPIKWRFGVVVT